MRNSWLLLITMLILPVRGFAQENPDNEAGVQTDSTTVQRDNASIQTDTASAQQDSSAVLHEMQELDRLSIHDKDPVLISPTPFRWAHGILPTFRQVTRSIISSRPRIMDRPGWSGCCLTAG